jgi:hypothetical protein
VVTSGSGNASVCPTALTTVPTGAPVLATATVMPEPPRLNCAELPPTGLMLPLPFPDPCDPCELLGKPVTSTVNDEDWPTIVAVTVACPTAAPTRSTAHCNAVPLMTRAHWLVGMLPPGDEVEDRKPVPLFVAKATSPLTDVGATVAVQTVEAPTRIEEASQERAIEICETCVTERLVVPELAVLLESPE